MRRTGPGPALFALLAGLAAGAAADAAVVAYPAPAGEKASEDWKVAAGGKPVHVYTAPVLRGGPASFAYFDFSGSVQVTVASARPVESVKILPTSYGIKPSVSGRSVSFTLMKPAHLTVELNGSIERPLHLFANPPEADPPKPGDTGVIYFGPGVHEVTTLRPKSGQTVYLAGGAILRGTIAPDEKPTQEKNWKGNKVWATLLETGGAKGVTVRGRGILDLGTLPWHARTAMWFGGSTDVLVEGIVILDAPAWVVAMHNSKGVVVRNVKQICARENSDGVDICNSQDIRVEECRNTLVNCWIGADMWGHDKMRGVIRGVVFKDIRVAGKTFPVSKLTGFDEAHAVEDVAFERLRIQGNLIGDAAAAKLQTNAHVRNVRFVTTGRP